KAALCLLVVIFYSTIAFTQSQQNRVAFGIDMETNKLYGSFLDDQFWRSSDAFARWNIQDWLSLHLAYNAGQMRYKGTSLSGGELGTLNHMRYAGWQAMVSGNLFATQQFVPFALIGIEALNFEPKDVTDASLPNNAKGVYDKNVIGEVIGL